MAKILACKAGASTAEVVQAREAAKIDPSLAEQLTRRARHWSDGVIFGSRIFVMEIAAKHRDKLAPEHPERIEKHRLGQLAATSDIAIFAWRNLQKNLT